MDGRVRLFVAHDSPTQPWKTLVVRQAVPEWEVTGITTRLALTRPLGQSRIFTR